MVKVKPFIEAMSLYAPPWSFMDRKDYLRLDLNENTLDPPDRVKAALKDYIDDNRFQMYPDYAEFLKTLSEYSCVAPEHLIVTNGSDQAIEILLRAFLGPGDEMVIAEPAFPMFAQIAGVIGARLKGVPYDEDLRFPFRKLMAAIGPETRLIVVINPNNPTGSGVLRDTIREILEANPEIPVIVDEAYYEFTEETALDFLTAYPNLIITRTFSKAFSMAGLRMGYAIAHPELIRQFHKVRGPFDVNSCALVAAKTQIEYPDNWKRFVREVMCESKPFLEKFFEKHGVFYFPGAAHFMLVRPQDRDGAVAFLKKKGILVRPMTAPSISDTFRMNLGTLEQMHRFAECFEEYLGKAAG